jgi:DNA-binding CsgD family transcriptional regulator
VKHARDIAHIRQLCCLGVGGEIIMPVLSQALRKVIPSSTYAFFWADESGNVTKAYQEPFTPEIIELFFAEFYNKRELDAWPVVQKYMREGADTGWNLANVDKKRFYRSDFYNVCLRPRNSYDPVYARIREGGRLVGAVVLSRGSKDEPFLQSDLDLLAQLAPYISHALRRRDEVNPDFVDSGEGGLIILNRESKILYMSNRARQLLYFATHPQVSPKSPSQSKSVIVPSAVQQLVCNLADTFNGQAAPPPVLHHQNQWGKFVFCAYWLEQDRSNVSSDTLNQNPPETALIGVTIQYQEPLSLKLMRAMQALPLSPREKEICLLIAEGSSHPAIAKRLGVRITTVKTLVQSVYEKLGVRGHEKLIKSISNVSWT